MTRPVAIELSAAEAVVLYWTLEGCGRRSIALLLDARFPADATGPLWTANDVRIIQAHLGDRARRAHDDARAHANASFDARRRP